MTILILCLALTVLLGAQSVNVRGIELLEGDHVIQVRFVTSEAIPPIPDVTEKEGNRLLLVSPELTFQLNQSQFQFDSLLVKAVNVSGAGVEIQLHAHSQYRLFSNNEGLFIEFPKPTAAPARQAELVVANESGGVNIGAEGLNVKVQAVTEDSVALLLTVPSETPYEIIPIEKEPYRLAIDLQGVKGRAVKTDIDKFNVRKVRGGPNTPDVYRVVFDLNYLSNYRVEAVADGLLVHFFGHAVPPEPVTVVAQRQQPQAASTEELVTQQVLPITEAVEGPFFKEEAAMAQPFPQESGTVKDNEESAQQIPMNKVIEEGATLYTGAPYDFVFKNSDLVNVLKIIAKLADLNLVVDPGVSGRVTSELVQVPWDQALDIFLKINKLDKVREGNILRIGNVEDLSKEAEQRRKLKEAREMDGKLEVIIRPLSYAKAGEVAKILEKQLSKRGDMQIDGRSNSLIISEVPDRVKILDRLIESLDSAVQQVSIEARIVESKKGYSKAFGIMWGLSGIMSPRYGNQTTLKFPNSISVGGALQSGYAVNLPLNNTKGPNTALGISFGNVAGTFNLDAAISAMESKGAAKVLSSPRITTQNNMQAEIISGSKVPVQTQQPNGTYSTRYINAALELTVTPQITAEGTIITDVEIRNDAPDWDPSRRIMGNPPIDTQSSKNTVMVTDGGTIVIGGLYRIETNQGTDRVPLLGNIPLLGSLFRNKNDSYDKKELLIFITPRIVK